jgi:aspartyl/asparaginyl-tRNA synthetase
MRTLPMRDLYEHYLRVLTLIREFFRERDVVEFLPACSTPRLITGLEDQMTVPSHNLILPYSQTFAKPVASLLLERSVWMAAPCYRRDEGRAHLEWYYQITAEFLGLRLDDVVPIACDLVRTVCRGVGRDLAEFETVDLAAEHDVATDEAFDAWCEAWKRDATRPLVALNKPHAAPPYAHRSYRERPNLEVGFDLLLPGIGEVMSGGERNMELIRETYRFSDVDLPRAHSASLGMGLERLVAYLLDLSDLRDAVLLQNRVADVPWDDLLAQRMYYERIPLEGGEA